MNEEEISSKKYIFGHFSLLASKGWIPGKKEIVRCSFKLFQYPVLEEEGEEDDVDEDNKKKKNFGENQEQDEEKSRRERYAQHVGDCEIDLVMP